jgi:hypothetical protein
VIAVAERTVELRGPRVAYLRGRVRCPLAGVGTRADDESNRLFIDDPSTTATIDGSTITLRDDRRPATRTVIADLVWLAQGQGVGGRPAPFTIHLELFKTGDTWSIDLHTHEPTRLADRATAVYEPLTIVAVSGSRRELLVDPALLARTVGRVPLARRLSGAMMTMRDHAPSGPGVVLDRSVGIGAMGRGLFLLRGRLIRLDAPAAAGLGAPLTSLLCAGTWELSLETLSDRWLPEIVARDLVLFEIADIPLLADLRAGKLRRGQTLAFRTDGQVRLDDAVAPLPGALDLARAYLEFHMLGGIICAAMASRGSA